MKKPHPKRSTDAYPVERIIAEIQTLKQDVRIIYNLLTLLAQGRLDAYNEQQRKK